MIKKSNQIKTNNMNQQRLRLAIQKSGRLSDGSKKLIKECGINIQNGKNQLIAPAPNFPLDLLYLRNDDIPKYVENGTADIGIVGENILIEQSPVVTKLQKMGFSKCRLSLAIPKGENYTDLSYFEGKKIATSYPNTLQQFLMQNNIQADIHRISGSVEIAPSIGLADAVCDIVSSGSTLFSNGLKEVKVVLKSEAVLIANKNIDDDKQNIINQLQFRINAVNRAKSNKYILLNAPNNNLKAISKVLPGMKSPTIIPLAESGWSAVHSVVNESDFWSKIDQLRALGAEGILVIPIEKMIA